MTDIDTIFENDVVGRLNDITTANGYLNDASVLDGYLVHYVNDLLNETNGVSFPCIAAQPISDSVNQSQTGVKASIARSIRVVGAVSVKERALVNRNLNALVLDTRKALSMDKFNNKSKAKSIDLGETIYNLPERNDQYAFFEMTITINYIENWQ